MFGPALFEKTDEEFPGSDSSHSHSHSFEVEEANRRTSTKQIEDAVMQEENDIT